MADVRRSVTWEDLGFSHDVRTGRWEDSALRAKGHHYDPNQARDPGGADGGRWVKGPGGAASFADKIAGALKDADALTAAPVRVVRDDEAHTLTVTGVPEAQHHDIRRALLHYVDGTYEDVNGILRGGAVGGDRTRAEASIEHIDVAMTHSQLSHDVVTHRGIQDGRAVFGDAFDSDMTGLRYREPAYSSTTADRRIVDSFVYAGDPAPTELRIHVPAGTRAVNLSRFGEDSADEAELLLDRDTSFRVVGDRSADGRRYLDVEVVT